MRRHLVLALAMAALCRAALGGEKSWIFRPSAYSHDPKTGDRVNQFAEAAPAYVRDDPTYQESGYRHSRWTRLYGDSSDHMHVVETWGQGDSIRPYGEWLYPYRPGATPYGPWGNSEGSPEGYPGGYPGGPGATPYGPWANPYGSGQPYGPWGVLPNMPPAAQYGVQQPQGSGVGAQGLGTVPPVPQAGNSRTGPPRATPPARPGVSLSPPRTGGVEY